MDGKTKDLLQTYLRRLTNLTTNNRSLLLLRASGDQLVDLQSLSYLNGEKAFDIIRTLIAGRSRKICQVVDARMEENNRLSRKLRLLDRADHFLFEESGVKDLHVGWPFVRGKFNNGTMVRCPLLFFPVTLITRDNDWVLQPREDAGISLNKTFLLAYAFYNKTPPDETLLESTFEDFNSDSTVFRTELYQLLKDKIELHFNPDNFRDELISFETFKRKEMEEGFENGSLKLHPEAVLGIFPQTGSRLVPDYLSLIEQQEFEDLESFFVERGQPRDKESVRVTEAKIFTPFMIDGSQEKAIRNLKEGRSLVVQGPPGTGKSQLIANLIADGMASGLRVLLVSQKRAALDVVYERLAGIGLDAFAGLVHDYRNDRKKIFEKIASQIENIDEFRARNRSVDVILMERRFLQVSHRIDQILEELEEFRQALFSEDECGISAKELYLTSERQGESVNLKQEYQYFDLSKLNSFLLVLKSYVDYASTFEMDGYPWKERVSFSNFHLEDYKSIEACVTSVQREQEMLRKAVREQIPVDINLEEAMALNDRLASFREMLRLLSTPDRFRYFQAMSEQTDEETSQLWLSNMERVCLNCFDEHGVEHSVPSSQLGEIQLALQQRMKARRSFVRRIRWEFFSEHSFLLKRVLVANSLLYDKQGLRTLERRIDNRLNLEHHLTALRQRVWLQDVPVDYQLESVGNWFQAQKDALKSKLILRALREISEGVLPRDYEQKAFVDRLSTVADLLDSIPAKVAGWSRYLSSFQLRQLAGNAGAQHEFLSTLKRDFDSLCEFDKLKESLQDYERSVISKLIGQLHAWDYANFEHLFQNSIRLAWLDHIETKFPALRIVSTLRISQLEEELQSITVEKRKLSREITQVKARERIYDQLEYNRLSNRITYRDLQHQVTKKRKIWPLRRAITEYGDELLRLLPCWMASPESVSAIFPMQGLFDLVLFDEASQCFSERGIPAMYRGRQILVAGDSKQLRPNDLYVVRWSDDQEERSPESDADSLLDLVSRYLPTVTLTGHYRSRSPELIDFSNAHFYGRRLQMLPDREQLNAHQPAIRYHRVEGVWEDQTNPVEAEAVVALVESMIHEPITRSIGIITFNAPQQTLIQDRLEKAGLPSGNEQIFVKNIENVQGDERDVIIFSIGYAPDKHRKFHMQFGSLNVDGGENRLNVAITRARDQIIIVSSILPEQLKTGETLNPGPKLLKAYLQFACEVSDGKFAPSGGPQRDYNSHWYLRKKIVAGHTGVDGVEIIESRYPFSDVLVRRDGLYTGVLVTDDEDYHQAFSMKDPHATVPLLQEKKHWISKRVFSRNVWLSPEEFYTEISKFTYR